MDNRDFRNQTTCEWLARTRGPHTTRLPVTAGDVRVRKPDPACFRLGPSRLGGEGMDPSKILVLEDPPARVKADRTAGYSVVALATTHEKAVLQEAEPDWIVEVMRGVRPLDCLTGM